MRTNQRVVWAAALALVLTGASCGARKKTVHRSSKPASGLEEPRRSGGDMSTGIERTAPAKPCDPPPCADEAPPDPQATPCEGDDCD